MRDAVSLVQNYLDNNGWEYEIQDSGPYLEFVLEKNYKQQYIIRANKSFPRISIGCLISMDSQIIEDKWDRLLEAVNITSSFSSFQAMAFRELGIYIRYYLPEACVVDSIDDVLKELLYYLLNHTCFELFDQAILSDVDLYNYYDAWHKDRCKVFRKSMEEYNKEV